MDVQSLGYRTDLGLLRLQGSTLEDRGDHLVIRTPANPTYWWGNFLLLAAPPTRDAAQRWLDRFAATFPDAEHVAIGFDGTSGELADVEGFTDAGLSADLSAVMTAETVDDPPHPNVEAVFRTLDGDADWEQYLDLEMACNDSHQPEAFRTFAERRRSVFRALVEAGSGAWFGAFVEGELRSSLGLLQVEPGLARFQNVQTHPDARGRGLAGTLVHHASLYGFSTLGARTLVMVADTSYSAIRIYRSVGFAETEHMLAVERAPRADEAEPARPA